MNRATTIAADVSSIRQALSDVEHDAVFHFPAFSRVKDLHQPMAELEKDSDMVILVVSG
jgi:hypothetical protein